MAVIIQQLAGRDYGGWWYPALSGVVQSHNFYPVMAMRADEGIASIALGIGKTVVEGEKSLWFSPAHPQKLIQFSTVEDMLNNSQRQFYALDMRRTPACSGGSRILCAATSRMPRTNSRCGCWPQPISPRSIGYGTPICRARKSLPSPRSSNMADIRWRRSSPSCCVSARGHGL